MINEWTAELIATALLGMYAALVTWINQHPEADTP